MPGKYRAYPEYKDSGVEWLDDVPHEWSVTRLKYVASIFGRIGFRGYTVEDIVDEGEGAIVLSPSNIDEDRFSLEKKAYLSWRKYYESPEIMVENGDILLVKTGSTFGKSTLVKNIDEPMTINPQMAIIKKPNIDGRFLIYLLNSRLIKSKIDVINTGSGMPTMTQENINKFPVLRPDDSGATKIANFLDHETAKIDTLIEKQQQLIKLLKEKRQAVISHAVTKGLNPKAKMKDSGVEWLGEVPEHWRILKGGFIGKLFGSESVSDDEVKSEGDFPFIKVSTLSADGFELGETDFFVDKPFWRPLKTSINYVVFPKRGAAIFTNKVNIVKIDSLIDPNLMGWYIGYNARAEYIAYLLKLRGLGDIADVSTVPQINNKHIEPTKFPVPPIIEQDEIVAFLKKSTSQLDDLVLKALSAIELMQERRTALISAAVTGKIDVRNWQAPKESKTNKEMAA